MHHLSHDSKCDHTCTAPADSIYMDKLGRHMHGGEGGGENTIARGPKKVLILKHSTGTSQWAVSS